MDSLETEELILYAAGLKEEEVETFINDGEDIDDFCNEKFEMGTEQFAKVAEGLLKFTPVVGSELTGTYYHAFVRPLDDKGMIAIVKQKA